MQKIVVVSGGFDPVHGGHIRLFEEAKKLGDTLVVALNSDAWLTKKKGRPFMSWSERAAVIKALRVVDEVLAFEDDERGTAIDALLKARAMYPAAHIIFANGGDRTKQNVPEMEIGDENMTFVFGVGGEDKHNSSSKLLSDWNEFLDSKINIF